MRSDRVVSGAPPPQGGKSGAVGGSVLEPVLEFVGVFLFVAQDVFEQAPRRRVALADQPDDLAVGLDRHAFGDQVGFDHGFQVERFVVGGVAALGQRVG